MPFTDEAYFEGKNWPRCKAQPSKEDNLYKYGVFECALPEGHEDFEDSKYHAHSWSQVGEV